MTTNTTPGAVVATDRRGWREALARRLGAWWPWLAGLGVAVAVIGPGLGPGPLLSLDLVLTPELPVPPGVWGLGPELAQRVPFGLPLAWLGALVGGPAAGKVFLVAAITVAFAGAVRLAAGSPAVARAGAGLLYAAGPFLATRLGAGHLNVLVAAAALPWAMPHLLLPARDVRKTFLAAAGMGLAGPAGGALALVAVVVGVVADRGRRAVPVLLVVAAGQLPWVVPAAVVWLGSDVAISGAASFPTRVDGIGGALSLLVGGGFWRSSNQVGATGLLAALAAAVVGGLAVAGARRLTGGWGGRAAALAAVGLVVTVSSAVPGLRGVVADVTALAVGAPYRETHRMLLLTLVWLAPDAAAGATYLAGRMTAWREVVLAAPLAVGLVVAGPGLWGVGDRLDPVEIPAGWAAVRDALEGRPGTVLALPWHQYLDIGFAGDRRVLNPLPDYLGGDVLRSSDPELGTGRQEQADPRAVVATLVVEDVVHDRPGSRSMADLGVRWVVLLHEADWEAYGSLVDDPGLTPIVRTDDIDLWEVDGWRGRVLVDGIAVPADRVVAPLWRIPGSGPAVWYRAGSSGWLRGLEGATVTEDGNLALPDGAGPVWYWPALVCLLVAGGVAAAVVLTALQLRPTDEEGA